MRKIFSLLLLLQVFWVLSPSAVPCAYAGSPEGIVAGVAKGAAKADAENSVVIATGEWPPYASEALPYGGILGHVVTAAFEASGIAVRFEYYPWRRVEQLIKTGRVAASFPWSPTVERLRWSAFSSPMLYTANVFFYRRDALGAFDYNGMTSLRGYDIAAMRGYFYEEIFRGKELDVMYTDMDSAFSKLQALRAELLPEDYTSGWFTIRKRFPDEIQYFANSCTPFTRTSAHMMFSTCRPDSIRLKKAFENGLESIRRNGVLQEILELYGVADLQSPDWKIPCS